MTTKRKNILIAACFTGVILACDAGLVISGQVAAEHFVANVVGATVVTIGVIALLWYAMLRTPRPPRYKLGAITFTLAFLLFCMGAALNHPDRWYGYHWFEYLQAAVFVGYLPWLWFNAIRHWHDKPEPTLDGLG